VPPGYPAPGSGQLSAQGLGRGLAGVGGRLLGPARGFRVESPGPHGLGCGAPPSALGGGVEAPLGIGAEAARSWAPALGSRGLSGCCWGVPTAGWPPASVGTVGENLRSCSLKLIEIEGKLVLVLYYYYFLILSTGTTF
jgi:hypothetical protein